MDRPRPMRPDQRLLRAAGAKHSCLRLLGVPPTPKLAKAATVSKRVHALSIHVSAGQCTSHPRVVNWNGGAHT